MNGKGSVPRPFSVPQDVFETNMIKSIHNPRDMYRLAVVSPDFDEKYPDLTGNWGEDREKWLQIIISLQNTI
jgi:hypothetical protein